MKFLIFLDKISINTRYMNENADRIIIDFILFSFMLEISTPQIVVIDKEIAAEQIGIKFAFIIFTLFPVRIIKPKYDITKDTVYEIIVPRGAQSIPKLVYLIISQVKIILARAPAEIDSTGICTLPVDSRALLITAVKPSNIMLGEITERSINPSVTLPDSKIIPKSLDGKIIKTIKQGTVKNETNDNESLTLSV